MMEAMVAVGIAMVILVGMVLWVLFLDVVCPPCARYMARRSSESGETVALEEQQVERRRAG